MAALSIKQILTGTVPLASGDAFVDVSLSPSVTRSKCFLVFRVSSGDTWTPQRHYCAGLIASDGSKITFTRASNPAVDTVITWYIVECDAGFTTTWLSIDTGDSWGGTHNETISSVTLARTMVIASHQGRTSGTASANHYVTRFELTSTTNLRLTCLQSALSVAAEVQIVEFDSDSGVSVQQITQTLTTASSADTSISAVTVANTLLFGSVDTTTTTNQDQHATGWSELTSTTNLRTIRIGSTGDLTGTTFVVDFGGGAAQRGWQTNSSYTSATMTETISAVTVANSTVQIGGGPFTYGQVGAGNSNWHQRMFRPTITSTTQITATREVTNSTTCAMYWQVMDWTALMGGGPTYTLTMGGATATLVGQAVSLKAGRLLAMSGATASTVGQSVGLRAGRYLSLAGGTATTVGQAVDLIYTPLGGPTYTLVMGAGTATTVGQAVGLRANRRVEMGGAIASMQGQGVGLARGYSLVMGGGTAAMQGQAVGLRASRRIGIEPAIASMVGQSINFTYSGQSLWTVQTPDATAWSPQGAVTTTWTEQ